MNISRGWILGVVVLVVAACGDNRETPKPDAAPDAIVQTPAERGAYIMNTLAACTFCHTPLLPNGARDLEKQFSGVDCFVDLDSPDFTDNHNNFGCLSTRNLTPDPTGLGNATDAQIKNAFRNGVRTDGKKIVPVMPWYIFHNMTDDDADAIVAYLRSVPAVSHAVKPNEMPWTLYNDGVNIFAPIEVTPLLDNEIPYPQGGENNQSAMNGRYLAAKVGLCVDCHTPEVFPNTIKLDMSLAFGGGKVFPKGALGLIDPSYPAAIATRNLTPDATGLMGWTKAQIKAAIAEGRDQTNHQVCAATHGGLISPYAGLEPQDLDDIVEYISLLPPVVNDTITGSIPTATSNHWANCGLPALPPDPAFPPSPETGADCANSADDDSDGVVNDGCPETGAQCANAVDDDSDGVPNDGCPVNCGDCQGPLVP